MFFRAIARPKVPVPVPRARYSKLTLANLKILHDHDYYAYEPLDVPEHLVVARNQHVDGEADPIEYPPFANPDQDGSVEEIPVQRSSSDRSSSGVF